MKAEIVNVTPKQAREWLASNTDNRPLRRAVVDGFKQALLRGEYLPTHQGIAFAKDGTLLDGQHRLTAIAELQDGVFPMLVTWGLSNDAFRVMDIGLKRQASDSLKEEKKLVEVARIITTICQNNGFTITPTMLIPVIDRIRPFHDGLLAFAPSTTRYFSAAPVRTAAVVCAMSWLDFDYIKAVYRSLVVSDFSSMPPIAHALVRSVQNGVARPGNWQDMLARCMVVFDPKNANLSKIQVKDPSKANAQVRSRFSDIDFALEAPKKKAAPNGAAKGVLQGVNYTAHKGARQ